MVLSFKKLYKYNIFLFPSKLRAPTYWLIEQPSSYFTLILHMWKLRHVDKKDFQIPTTSPVEGQGIKFVTGIKLNKSCI